MRRSALIAFGITAAAAVALANPATAATNAYPGATTVAGPRPGTALVAQPAAGYPGIKPAAGYPGVDPAAAHLTVIAKHLRNPRGITLAPGGVVLVAEAGNGGAGPCSPDPEDPTSKVCFGRTSGVTAIAFGHAHRVITGLPSLAGMDGSAGVGLDNVTLTPHGLVGIVGLGGDLALRKKFGKRGALLGHVVGLRPGSAPTKIADLTAYEAAHNPDAGDPGSAVDSDPYDVVATRHGLYAVDAGGNDVLNIGHTGHVSTTAVLHARQTDAPPFLGLPPGTKIPYQSVPDAITQGCDGALYVGELTGFPFPIGAANVYRIVPGHKPTVYASGFTNIIDVTFDRQGNLYVLEIAKDSLLGNSQVGALIKVDRKGHRTEIARGQLNAPGGVAIAHDGSIYVSVNSVSGSDGQVVRIKQ